MVISGARLVGKTWLMQKFGRTAFDSVAYINFDHNTWMQGLFHGDLNVERLLRGMSNESSVDIDPKKTLIILDEVQEAPAALTSLKYFAEDDRRRYFILAAGSGGCHGRWRSIPRGKGRTAGALSSEFPDSVETIEPETFQGCTKLSTFVVPEGVTSIEDFIPNGTADNAFRDCLSLVSIYIPESLLVISPNTFEGTGIQDIFYSGSEERWKAVTKYVRIPECVRIHYNTIVHY